MSRHSSPPSQPHTPESTFYPWTCPLWTFHRNGVTCQAALCAWHLSRSTVFRARPHRGACEAPLLFTTEKYPGVWMDHIPFIYLSISGNWFPRFGCYNLLLWSVVYEGHCGRACAFPLGTDPGVDLLGHVVTVPDCLGSYQTALPSGGSAHTSTCHGQGSSFPCPGLCALGGAWPHSRGQLPSAAAAWGPPAPTFPTAAQIRVGLGVRWGQTQLLTFGF